MLIKQLQNFFSPWRPTSKYIYTHTHTLIIQQRQEVKQGGQGHLVFSWAGRNQYCFHSPQTTSWSRLPRMLWSTAIITRQMSLFRSYVNLPKVTAVIPMTHGSSSTPTVGTRQTCPYPPRTRSSSAARHRDRRCWPPPSPAPLTSPPRSLAGGWKLLKRMNTSQEILTLNICRLASASSAV